MFDFNATFLIAMLSFIVFIMIMNAILYKPVLSIMRKREEYINSNYDNAKIYVAKAGDNENERNAKIEQTQIQCRKIIRNAVEEAHKFANERTHSAREKSKAEILSRKDSLSLEEQRLEDEVNNTVVKDLASSITSKIIGKNIRVER